jgi:hypothetical protein
LFRSPWSRSNPLDWAQTSHALINLAVLRLPPKLRINS